MSIAYRTKLTASQERFVELYLQNNNATQSYSEAYPNNKMSYKTLGHEAHLLLKQDKIQNRIAERKQELADKNDIKKSDLLLELLDIARERSERTSDRISAYDKIGKWLGFDAPIKTDNELKINILKTVNNASAND